MHDEALIDYGGCEPRQRIQAKEFQVFSKEQFVQKADGICSGWVSYIVEHVNMGHDRSLSAQLRNGSVGYAFGKHL